MQCRFCFFLPAAAAAVPLARPRSSHCSQREQGPGSRRAARRGAHWAPFPWSTEGVRPGSPRACVTDPPRWGAAARLPGSACVGAPLHLAASTLQRRRRHTQHLAALSSAALCAEQETFRLSCLLLLLWLAPARLAQAQLAGGAAASRTTARPTTDCPFPLTQTAALPCSAAGRLRTPWGPSCTAQRPAPAPPGRAV